MVAPCAKGHLQGQARWKQMRLFTKTAGPNGKPPWFFRCADVLKIEPGFA
jgi:hypothetical protein